MRRVPWPVVLFPFIISDLLFIVDVEADFGKVRDSHRKIIMQLESQITINLSAFRREAIIITYGRNGDSVMFTLQDITSLFDNSLVVGPVEEWYENSIVFCDDLDRYLVVVLKSGLVFAVDTVDRRLVLLSAISEDKRTVLEASIREKALEYVVSLRLSEKIAGVIACGNFGITEAIPVLREYTSECLGWNFNSIRAYVKRALEQLGEDTRGIVVSSRESDPERSNIHFLPSECEHRFVDNFDGTVTDSCTGLMWTQRDSCNDKGGCNNWEDAFAFVDNLHVGDYSDWRLPSLEELNTLYDEKYVNCSWMGYPLRISSIFRYGGAYECWSNESANEWMAYVYDFWRGKAFVEMKNRCNSLYSYGCMVGIRAVRLQDKRMFPLASDEPH